MSTTVAAAATGGRTLAALREATGAIHARLHGLPAFAAIVDGTIDLADYRALLVRLHGFHAPLEAAFAERADDLARYGVDVAARCRVPALVADLAALGERAGTFPATRLETRTRSTAGLLGLLYVREGSLLGGRVIARHLDTLFGSGLVGRRFFSGDPRTAAQWRDTCAALERVAADGPDAVDEVVDGARYAFERFERWMT